MLNFMLLQYNYRYICTVEVEYIILFNNYNINHTKKFKLQLHLYQVVLQIYSTLIYNKTKYLIITKNYPFHSIKFSV